jgi:protoporphyrinogen IX oxidase
MDGTGLQSIFDYNWLRGFHLIFVIAWMAAFVMLPRLYAYQTGSVPGGELDQKMTVAARNLVRIIFTPSLIVVWVLGLLLLWLYHPEWTREGWLHIKLALVLGLSGLHGWLIGQGRKLAAGERRYSEKFWRLLNEAPFLVAIAVVLLATVKPF